MNVRVFRIVEGKPESFGWMRRSDHDTLTGIAYERPNGTLYLFAKSLGKPWFKMARRMPIEKPQ